MKKMQKHVGLVLHSSLMTAMKSFVLLPVFYYLYFALGKIFRFEIEIIQQSGFLIFWLLPALLLALIYSLLITPVVIWLEPKEAYEKYRLYLFRYMLFFPFFVVTAGAFCMESLCYV